jgi:hypothetical protein
VTHTAPLDPSLWDETIPVADDFYHHVNARWLAANPVPAEYPMWGAREKGGLAGLDDRWIDLRVDDHTDPTAELARLLALHEQQSNVADPENLPKIASALASGLVGALRNAVKPPEPAPAGRLTASSPPAAASHATTTVPDGDAG